MEEMKAAESWYLLCLMLLNINLFNALWLVIIADVPSQAQVQGVLQGQEDHAPLLWVHLLHFGRSPISSALLWYVFQHLDTFGDQSNLCFLLQGWHRAAGVAAVTAITCWPSSMRQSG